MRDSEEGDPGFHTVQGVGPPTRHPHDHVPAPPLQAPAASRGIEGHFDLLTGAALLGAPIAEASRSVDGNQGAIGPPVRGPHDHGPLGALTGSRHPPPAGSGAPIQRLSLNPVAWARRVWGRVKALGTTALGKARDLGASALGKARAAGSGLAGRVGSAITGALTTITTAVRTGAARLGSAVTSALATIGGMARRGLAAAGGVAQRALQGALRLGRGAWDHAVSAGRRALDMARRSGRQLLDAGRSLASRAWGVVKGRVGGLWTGFKARVNGLKQRVVRTASGLLARGRALGGRAVSAASGFADRLGGSICSAIGKATKWVYGKVAPLARKAWDWASKNPVKAIAMLLVPGGPLIALGHAIAGKMVDLATRVFGPAMRAIAAKARATWQAAKRLGARAWNTARRWGSRAVQGAASLGRRALGAARRFGGSILGSARSVGRRVVGRAKAFGTAVLGRAKALGARVWGTAKALGGKLMGVADRLTGGLASKIKGMAGRMLDKASGVLGWVMGKARSLAKRALSSARSLASRVLSRARSFASRAWNGAKALGRRVATSARSFASRAWARGKAMLTRAGRQAKAFGRRALNGARALGSRAVATAKQWGSRAWGAAKRLGAQAWDKAKEYGGRAWAATKRQAARAWRAAKRVGAKLAPYASKALDRAKRIGKALGVDRVVAAVKSLGKEAMALAKRGLVAMKDKVLPVLEKLRQARNKVMAYTQVGLLCKAAGCAAKGFIPPKGGEDLQAGLDITTDLVPVVSTVKDICTCAIGENVVTNKAVGAGEQGMACAFAALDVAAYAAGAFTAGGTAAGAIALRTALKGGVRVGGKLLAKEALEAAVKRGGKALAQELGQEGMEQFIKGLGKEGMQNLAQEMGEKEFKHFVRAASEQGVKGLDDVARGADTAIDAAKASDKASDAGKTTDAARPGGKAGTHPDSPPGAKVTDSPAGVGVCVVQAARHSLRPLGRAARARPGIDAPGPNVTCGHARLPVPNAPMQLRPRPPTPPSLVVQRGGGKKDVCALLPRDIPKASTQALKDLAASGRGLPPRLVDDLELLTRIARDPDATAGLCAMMRRVDTLDPMAQQAFVDALQTHGDTLFPLLRRYDDGLKRLTTPEIRETMAALSKLPAGLQGISRWVDRLAHASKTGKQGGRLTPMQKGVLGEIEFAAKVQQDLAGTGKKIGTVAHVVDGKDAGDILVVTLKGKTTDVVDVKAFDWSKPAYSDPAKVKLYIKSIKKQRSHHKQRYPGAKIFFGFPPGMPAPFLDALKKAKIRIWQ